MYKRIVSAGIILVLLFGMFAVPAMASAGDKDSVDVVNESALVPKENDWISSHTEVPGMVSAHKDNLYLYVTTDPEGYKAEEPVSFEIRLQNLNKISLKNVSIGQILPDGYKLTEESETLLDIGTLKPGENKTVVLTCEPGEEAEKSFVLPSCFGLLLFACMIGGVVCLKKKKRFLCLISFSVGACALVGIIVLLVSNIIIKDKRCVTQVYSKVLVDSNEHTFGTEVRYDDPTLAPDDAVLEFLLLFDDQLVKNIEEYESIILKKGDAIPKVNDPECEFATFAGWYTDLDYTEEADLLKPISDNLILYAKWDVNKTDTDGDGLYDSVELYIGSDVMDTDTDDDKLNDYIEVNCGLDPCKADTDEDGISDYDEDSDEDTLQNGYEVEHGSNPALNDTDEDGLTDDLECMTYQTNPALADTDEDGGSDFWEINHGFDPLVKDESFLVKQETVAVSETLPVTAGVEVSLKGEQAETISVEKVKRSENYMVRATLPGYMGDAYEFTVEGEIEQATLSFAYDVELYGEPNEDFQPRIYYINEETGMYEELENQVVENGVVKAVTPHFSKYILLNKVEFDKIWEEEIMPPIEVTEEEGGGLAMVLLMDCSPSMAENDPKKIRLELISLFLDNLGKNDRAAVIPFSAKPYSDYKFTNNFEALKEYAASKTRSQGSNLSGPMECAIDMLNENKTSQYKYIVVLSDGECEYDSAFTEKAREAGIIVFTIGLGEYDRNPLLEEIANGTGGQFYPASFAEEFVETVEEASAKVVDYSSDSNGDGIKDYYAQLIREGKLPCADIFFGVDFDESPDLDGDGLLNGQEVVIYKSGGKVYMSMKSHPRLKDTDRDGILDVDDNYPTVYSISKEEFDHFCYDDNFFHVILANQYASQECIQDVVDIQAWIYDVKNSDMIAMDIMIDFFLKFPNEEYMEQKRIEKEADLIYDGIVGLIDNAIVACTEANREIVENTEEMLDTNESVKDINEFIKDAYELLDELVSVKDSKALDKVKSTMRRIIGKMDSKINPKVSLVLHKVPSDFMKQAKIVDEFEIMDKMVYAADLYHTVTSFTSISAECERFEECIWILDYVSKNARIDFVRRGASDFKRHLCGTYTVMIDEVLEMNVLNFTKKSVEKLLEKFTCTKCILLIRDGLDILFGIGNDIEQLYQMFTYAELGEAVELLIRRELTVVSDLTIRGWVEEYQCNKYYDTIDIQTCMIYLVALRFAGEEAYIDVIKCDGIFSLAKDVDTIIQDVRKNENVMAEKMFKLNIPWK